MSDVATEVTDGPGFGTLLPLNRQQCNLLLLRPLFELALRLRQDEGKRVFEGLDTNYLSLLLIDFLVEGGVLGRGRTYPEVLAFMAEAAQRIKPGLTEAEARRVGIEVLGALANADNRQERFEYQYFDAATRHTSRFAFSLLHYERGDDNTYRYRVTEQGFVLYLGMLDLGAADMQELMESMLAKLVARGRVSEALDVSRQSRLEAARYQETIRAHLERARRIPDSVTWQEDLEPFLNESRTHIDERQQHEQQLLAMVTERLQEADSAATREKLYRLKQTVDSEYRIHTQLLTLVGEAGQRYLRSQSALFRARSRQHLPNLDDRVLPELAQLSVASLAQVADREGFALLSAAPPRLLYLPQLFDLLLEPQPEDVAPPTSEDELVDITAPPLKFTPEDVAAAEKFLREALATNPRIDIQQILDQAEATGLQRTVQEYMTFLMYQSFARKESPFAVEVTVNGRFRSQVVEGGRLEFTRREPDHEPQ